MVKNFIYLIYKYIWFFFLTFFPKKDYNLKDEELNFEKVNFINESIIKKIFFKDNIYSSKHYNLEIHNFNFLFIAKEIGGKKGIEFSKKNISVVRPGYGKHPREFENIIGKIAKRNYKSGMPLNKI